MSLKFIIIFSHHPLTLSERVLIPLLLDHLKLFGDKGYISKALTSCLQLDQVQLVTGIKKNMKNKLVSLSDKLMLRKRALIETVNDQLKNISQIEHTRHRSLWNFLGNVAAGLIAYSFREKKPSLNLNKTAQFEPMAI